MPFLTLADYFWPLRISTPWTLFDRYFQEEKIREEEEAIKRKAEEEAKKKEAMAAMSMNYSGFMAKKQVNFQFFRLKNSPTTIRQ